MGWCGTLFIEFINASLRTRAMPVAGSVQERERERESRRKLRTSKMCHCIAKIRGTAAVYRVALTCGTPKYCIVQNIVSTVSTTVQADGEDREAEKNI